MSAHREFTEMTSPSFHWIRLCCVHCCIQECSHTLLPCLSLGASPLWCKQKKPVIACTMLGVIPLLPLVVNTVLGFRLCPSHCLCYESSDLVDCRSRGLVRVPASVPHSTWLLNLSGNKLTEVCTGSFMGLWSLKILIMSNNSIQTMQSQVTNI